MDTSSVVMNPLGGDKLLSLRAEYDVLARVGAANGRKMAVALDKGLVVTSAQLQFGLDLKTSKASLAAISATAARGVSGTASDAVTNLKTNYGALSALLDLATTA